MNCFVILAIRLEVKNLLRFLIDFSTKKLL